MCVLAEYATPTSHACRTHLVPKNQINTRVSNYTPQLEPKRTYMNHERMNNHETVVSV